VSGLIFGRTWVWMPEFLTTLKDRKKGKGLKERGSPARTHCLKRGRRDQDPRLQSADRRNRERGRGGGDCRNSTLVSLKNGGSDPKQNQRRVNKAGARAKGKRLASPAGSTSQWHSELL